MPKRRRLVHLCETRWTDRRESLMALIELLPVVVTCLEEMQVTGNLTFFRNASLLLNSLWTCASIMVLAIAQHMSSLLLPLTTQLQSKSLHLVACCTEVDAIVSVTLQEIRRCILIFFSKASELFQMVGIEITVPRLTDNWTSCKCNHSSACHGSKWRSILSSFRVNVFYLFLDYMLTELNDRFLCHRTNEFALQCLVQKIHADFIYNWYTASN